MFASRLKKFIRNNSPLFSVMFLLTVINIATTSYPWAIFPIAGMSIPVLISAAHIFLADENEDSDDSQQLSRDERRRLRDERRHGRAAGNTVTATAAAMAPLESSVAAQLAEAKRYREQLSALIKSSPGNANSNRLNDLSTQMDEWMNSIQQMAERVNVLKRNASARDDKATVGQSISKLQQQLTQETDERVRQQLERTLSARQQQRESLDKLDSLARQSEIQLESTVAALGTIYSQALAAQSTNQVANYSHLSTEVNEQVNTLRDHLEALEEVKLGDIQQSA